MTEGPVEFCIGADLSEELQWIVFQTIGRLHESKDMHRTNRGCR